MPDGSPFTVVELPVAVPDAARGGTCLADYVALLQKLCDARAELKEERASRAAAEDAAWLRVADLLHPLEQELKAAEGGSSCVQACIVEHLAAVWREQQIEFGGAAGGRFADLPPGEFEILATRQSERPGDAGIVVEVWRPAVHRRGRLIRTGLVTVVGG